MTALRQAAHGSVSRMALREDCVPTDLPGMPAVLPGPGLVMQLLGAGIPPSLLIDLLDLDGMRAALAAELAESDAATAIADGAVTWDALPSRQVLGIA